MFMEGFINSLAEFMGVDVTVAGLTMTVILTLSVVMAVVVATGGKHVELPTAVSSFFMVILCTVFGWLNVWISALFCLGLAVLTAWMLSRPGRALEA